MIESFGDVEKLVSLSKWHIIAFLLKKFCNSCIKAYCHIKDHSMNIYKLRLSIILYDVLGVKASQSWF